jgi:hypothetical protein
MSAAPGAARNFPSGAGGVQGLCRAGGCLRRLAPAPCLRGPVRSGEMSEERSKHSRAGPPSDTPAFSLVVTSRGDPERCARSSAAAPPLRGARGADGRGARRAGGGRARAGGRAPSAHFIHPRRAGAPGALRAAGMAAASGDVVLFGEDGDAGAPRAPPPPPELPRGLVPGCRRNLPERPRLLRTAAGTAGGEIPSSRQDLPSRDALEAANVILEHRSAPQHGPARPGRPGRHRGRRPRRLTAPTSWPARASR